MKITRDQLVGIMPTLKKNLSRADKFLPYLNKYMEEYEINTRLRVCHFLSQIAHESAELSVTVENMNYSPTRLRQVFRKYFPTTALANAYGHKPEKIGSRVYGGRNGNGVESTGDGFKYRGHGLIQLTFKSNYALYMKDTGVDVISNPDLLSLPDDAVRSAVWFWKRNGLNALADTDNITSVTRRINGGTNGLTQRKVYYQRAKLFIK